MLILLILLFCRIELFELLYRSCAMLMNDVQPAIFFLNIWLQNAEMLKLFGWYLKFGCSSSPDIRQKKISYRVSYMCLIPAWLLVDKDAKYCGVICCLIYASSSYFHMWKPPLLLKFRCIRAESGSGWATSPSNLVLLLPVALLFSLLIISFPKNSNYALTSITPHSAKVCKFLNLTAPECSITSSLRSCAPVPVFYDPPWDSHTCSALADLSPGIPLQSEISYQSELSSLVEIQRNQPQHKRNYWNQAWNELWVKFLCSIQQI